MINTIPVFLPALIFFVISGFSLVGMESTGQKKQSAKINPLFLTDAQLKEMAEKKFPKINESVVEISPYAFILGKYLYFIDYGNASQFYAVADANSSSAFDWYALPNNVKSIVCSPCGNKIAIFASGKYGVISTDEHFNEKKHTLTKSVIPGIADIFWLDEKMLVACGPNGFEIAAINNQNSLQSVGMHLFATQARSPEFSLKRITNENFLVARDGSDHYGLITIKNTTENHCEEKPFEGKEIPKDALIATNDNGLVAWCIDTTVYIGHFSKITSTDRRLSAKPLKLLYKIYALAFSPTGTHCAVATGSKNNPEAVDAIRIYGIWNDDLTTYPIGWVEFTNPLCCVKLLSWLSKTEVALYGQSKAESRSVSVAIHQNMLVGQQHIHGRKVGKIHQQH